MLGQPTPPKQPLSPLRSRFGGARSAAKAESPTLRLDYSRLEIERQEVIRGLVIGYSMLDVRRDRGVRDQGIRGLDTGFFRLR